MATYSETFSFGETHTGLSGSGNTLYTIPLDHGFEKIGGFGIDISVTGTNQHGSGGYPGVGVRLVNDNGGVLYRFHENDEGEGSWTFTSDSSGGYTLVQINVNDDITVTRDGQAETASSPSAAVTSTVYAEIYDSKGGGDTNDRIEDISGTASVEKRVLPPVNGRVPSSGWHVEVTHPESGRTLIPDVVDENVAVLPSLNSLPEVRIPIRKDSVWLDPSLEDGPDMAVFLDGERQPIERLTEVEDGTSHTVLHGVGGTQLRDRVPAEFSAENRHLAARELITSETDYNEDVDSPNVDEITGQTVQDTSGDGTFNDIIEVGETDPIDVSESSLSLKQTCFLSEAEDRDREGSFGFINEGQYSGGTAILLGDAGSYLEFDFTIDHTIPEEHVGLWIRKGASDNPPGYTISIDGTVSESVDSGIGLTLGWNDYASGAINFDSEWTGGPLEPGEYEVRIEVDSTTTGDYIVDVVALVDNRYNYNFDNDNGGNGGPLDGPELYPSAVDVAGVDYETAFSVTRGDFDMEMDDTGGNQRIQVSNDRGQNWVPSDGSENNTTSVDEGFGTTGASLRARVTLGAHSPNGARDQTPALGYESQEVTDWHLRSDVDVELLLVDQDYDNDLASILTSIAGDEFLWSFNLDDNGNPQLSWTEPGQRTAERDPDIGDISLTKSLDIWESVTVKGSNRTISGESFEASSTSHNLNRENLITGSETVFDSDGTNYERGADYEMDYSGGEVVTLDGGDLETGESYSIEYDIEVSGSYTVAGASSNPREFVETVPAVNSSRGAEQIAYVLASEYSEPRYAGTLNIPRSDVSFDPLEALTLTNLDLPDAATPLDIRGEPEITPTGVQVRLGNREELEQGLGQVAEQLREVSQQT